MHLMAATIARVLAWTRGPSGPGPRPGPVVVGMLVLAAIAVCIAVARHFRARTELPGYVALRGPRPTLDGELDEWTERRTEPFVDTMTGRSAGPHTTAMFRWDDDALYVAFEVDDRDLVAPDTEHDAHLWEHDCVELMIDPDGDGRDYVELQVSPRATVFDTRFESRRQPAPFGHLDYDSHLEPAVAVMGTIRGDGDEADRDRGYSVEIALPWSAFDAIGHHGAPRDGESFRIALYVLDTFDGGQRGAGWSPPLVGDYHVPDRFGVVTFAD